MEIEITNDKNRMEEIGKQLFHEKEKIYTPKMVNYLRNAIMHAKGELSETEYQSLFYRSIYDYWVYGINVDEEFYYDFLNKEHEEKSTYMTNRWRIEYIDHLNKKEDKYILENKYEAYKRFSKYFKRDVVEINGPEDYGLFQEFVKNHPSFVVKPGGLALGIGVYKVDKDDYTNIQDLFRKILEDNNKSVDDYAWSYSKGVVLEEIIQQEETMASLHPYSINGVRITTVKLGDEIHVVHPWLKIGANQGFVTSAAFGTMDAGIDPETGIVDSEGYLESRQSHRIHPNTNVEILGFQVPRWEEAVSLAKELAMQLDTLHYVGWDLALTPNGWCLMEGNIYGDFMWQLYYDKGMKAEFEELIRWKSDKKFWWG